MISLYFPKQLMSCRDSSTALRNLAREIESRNKVRHIRYNESIHDCLHQWHFRLIKSGLNELDGLYISTLAQVMLLCLVSVVDCSQVCTVTQMCYNTCSDYWRCNSEDGEFVFDKLYDLKNQGFPSWVSTSYNWPTYTKLIWSHESNACHICCRKYATDIC